MTIAYLGPSGSFSEQAARIAAQKLNNGAGAVFLPVHSPEDAVAAVTRKQADCAVVPVENSIEGAVNVTLDALIFDADVFIREQINLPVTQNLLVHPRAGGDAPARIYSHPQALAQSRRFLRAAYPDAALLPAPSTSEAAKMVAEEGADGTIAAVASVLAAELYGLTIRSASIQENDANVTQFVVVSAAPAADFRPGDKTSLAFSTANEPGALYKLLDIFALWDLNMTRIVSRPMKNQTGAYVFFVDVENPQNPDDVRDALTMVARKASFFKPLGSYPVRKADEI